MTTCLWRADPGIKCRKCSKSVWVWFVWLLVFGILWSLALDFEFFSGKLHLVPHILPYLFVFICIPQLAHFTYWVHKHLVSACQALSWVLRRQREEAAPVPGDTVVSMVGKEKKSRIKYSMITCSNRCPQWIWGIHGMPSTARAGFWRMTKSLLGKEGKQGSQVSWLGHDIQKQKHDLWFWKLERPESVQKNSSVCSRRVKKR